MRGHGLWWVAALVLATTLGAWGLAVANRSGEPEAVLDLTERELRLPAREADNSSLALGLVFERRRHGPVTGSGQPEIEGPGWFDCAKLQAIGFDCRTPVSPEQARRYRAQLSRTTYAALEYEGDAWQAQMRDAREPDAALDTHLVAIDVDNDPAALRRRHPDRRRVAIVEALASLRYVANPGQPPFVMGRVIAVAPAAINVPREWRASLEAFQAEQAPGVWPPPLREPRYRVTVKWGRRLEPWIAGVQPLAPAGPQ